MAERVSNGGRMDSATEDCCIECDLFLDLRDARSEKAQLLALLREWTLDADGDCMGCGHRKSHSTTCPLGVIDA